MYQKDRKQTEWAAGTNAPPISHPSRLCYCAPELIANPALQQDGQKPVPVTSAADIWSIGLVAYELLTQERVFSQGATPEQVMTRIGGGCRGRVA